MAEQITSECQGSRECPRCLALGSGCEADSEFVWLQLRGGERKCGLCLGGQRISRELHAAYTLLMLTRGPIDLFLNYEDVLHEIVMMRRALEPVTDEREHE